MAKYDLTVIGSGPAGMTAAIYGVRGNLKVLLLDKLAPGGAIVNTNVIENYPGVKNVGGADLAMLMFEQCQELGVEFDYKTVLSIEAEGEVKRIRCKEDDTVIEASTLIIAPGTRPRMLKVPGEFDYAGKQISWCAICDGAKYKGKDVVVIGGGNSAVDEGTYLASICNHVTIVTDFDLSGDPSSADYFRNLPNTEVHAYKAVKEFIAEGGRLTGVRFADKETGANEQVVRCDGVFEYIGATPSTEFCRDLGICESHGYVECDAHMRTKVPGLYGAGDSNSKFLRQIVTATADGATAAQEALAYVKEIRKQQANN